MTIDIKYCNSIHLTNAVEIDGTTSLMDVFLNGVIGVSVIKDNTDKKVKITFNTEETMSFAKKRTQWTCSAGESNTLLASVHKKGIKVKNLYYRGFDLLSNLSEGVKKG